jgi:hypothetical protein
MGRESRGEGLAILNLAVPSLPFGDGIESQSLILELWPVGTTDDLVDI